MNSGFRYILEPYTGPKSRFTCPNCNKPCQFTRYINIETGEYLADHVGICNKVNKCGYHYPPREYFKETEGDKRFAPVHTTRFDTGAYTGAQTRGNALQNATPDLIPRNLVEKTLSQDFYSRNNLVAFLRARFGNALTLNACKRFHIGTSKHWPGATIFWQIDDQNNTRTGKIMLYNPETGKRVKHPSNHITWVHTRLNVYQQRVAQREPTKVFNLKQCLFGLHQLRVAPVTTSVIIIVESEKTALIASIYLTQFTWMACGGIKNLTLQTLLPIKHCNIVLYPDLKGLSDWEAKALTLRENGFRVTVSCLLETLPNLTETDRESGHDLADFLLRFDPPKSPLIRLMEKNPTIALLVERFDLTVL